MSDSPKKRGRPPGKKKETFLQEADVKVKDLSPEQISSILKQLGINQNLATEIKREKNTFTKKPNKFVDDLSLCKEDLDFNKKVKFSVSDRVREEAGKDKKCENCQRTFRAYYKEFLCNDCATKAR